MEGFVAVLFILGAVTFWVLAAVNLSRSRQMGTFILHLGLFIFLGIILWFVIMSPVQGCTGFLCGLGEALLFVGLTYGAFLLWGLLLFLLTRGKKGAPRDLSNAETIDEITDEVF